MASTSASLLQRLSTGHDPVAWQRFVECYTPLLHSWCMRLGLSASDAADFIQDVYVILLVQFPRFKYDPNQSFRAWLKTILMNVWRKHARKASRIAYAQVDPDLMADSDPGQFLDRQEHHDFLIRKTLAIIEVDFDPITWKACWESLVGNRSATEVAAELGISVNSVYLAKSRVLRHLRIELQGLLD